MSGLLCVAVVAVLSMYGMQMPVSCVVALALNVRVYK